MYFSRRLRWRTFLTAASVTLLSAALLIGLITRSASRQAYAAFETQFATPLAQLASDPALVTAWTNDRSGLASLVDNLAQATGASVMAIGANGQLLAAAPMPDITPVILTQLPEVREALRSGSGRSQRSDQTTGKATLFLAQAVTDGGQTLGVLHWAVATTVLDNGIAAQRNQTTWLILLAAGVAITALALVLARGAHTVRQLTLLVDRALAGDYGGRVLAMDSGEINLLTLGVNQLVEKLATASGQGERARDQLELVLTRMTSGLLILNEHGDVQVINPAAANLLRTTAELALGRSFVQVVWDHRIAEVWLHCQQTRREASETLNLRSDCTIRVTVSPLHNTQEGYLMFMQDLTQSRLLEKMRRDFVSNVSHELRTPLASLGALVDTLRDGALDDPPAAQRFLDRMEVEVDKLTQMVQELLELSRIESGEAPLKMVTCTVRQFVQPAVDRLATQAERAGVTLELTLPASLPAVTADMERIQQVVINLVHNAIKFTPAGGRITVSARTTAGMMAVSVSDTGIGIPGPDVPRIFERFYKADRSRSGGGTGLGLAIAKHTVQAHGGQIWVESQENRGSTFTFTLPMAT